MRNVTVFSLYSSILAMTANAFTEDMEKSKEVLANGHETEGAKYKKKILNRQKKIYYSVLRLLIRPLRQLL